MNKKNLSLLLAAVVVVLAIIMLIMIIRNKNKAIAIPEKQVLNIEEVQEMSSDIDTKDWQTYQNEEYGFEFKYPKNWNISSTGWSMSAESKNPMLLSLALRSTESQKNIQQAQAQIDEDKKLGIANTYSGDAYYFSNNMVFEVFNNKPFLDDDPINKKIGEKNIGSKKAIEYWIGGYGSSYGLVIEHNDQFLLLDFKACGEDCVENKDNLPIELKKILNSFVFTE